MPPKKSLKNRSAASSANPSPAESQVKLSHRTCTGVWATHKDSRDIHIDNFSISAHGVRLVEDSRLELNYGNRYGFVGANGCGKSTVLEAIGTRELPIPPHFSVFLLDREAPASDTITAIEHVLCDVEERRAQLEKESERIAADESQHTYLEEIYEMLDALEIDRARVAAAKILHGLGFSKKMQDTPTKDFSGGWRMRISLARALLMKPDVLLLDEPTNHLDLEACVWLENYLQTYTRILLLVSHSQDFLNSVCTNIVLLRDRHLIYYGGNYDSYVKTRGEQEEHQTKQYDREQEEIAHLKDYIAKYGHGSAKLAKQAQSREKVLKKMEDSGLTEKVRADQVYRLQFENPGVLPPPIITFNQVTFGYTKNKILYRKLDFGVDLDSRIVLVGPNGAGKSTLLKLMVGDLTPTDGMVKRHSHVIIGQYHQHSAEVLDLDLTPLQFMMKEFGEDKGENELRKAIGRFGVSGVAQNNPIRVLSDGQRSRLVLAWIAYRTPHVMLLDEPTNHLSLELIDSLADALNEFKGGLVVVSHDFRLLEKIAKEIWECKDGQVKRFNGSIWDYKKKVRGELLDDL